MGKGASLACPSHRPSPTFFFPSPQPPYDIKRPPATEERGVMMLKLQPRYRGNEGHIAGIFQKGKGGWSHCVTPRVLIRLACRHHHLNKRDIKLLSHRGGGGRHGHQGFP